MGLRRVHVGYNSIENFTYTRYVSHGDKIESLMLEREDGGDFSANPVVLAAMDERAEARYRQWMGNNMETI
jgi:hypothetical protein